MASTPLELHPHMANWNLPSFKIILPLNFKTSRIYCLIVTSDYNPTFPVVFLYKSKDKNKKEINKKKIKHFRQEKVNELSFTHCPTLPNFNIVPDCTLDPFLFFFIRF